MTGPTAGTVPIDPPAAGSGGGPSPSPPPEPGPRARRRWLVYGVVLALAALVVLAVLVLPSRQPSGGCGDACPLDILPAPCSGGSSSVTIGCAAEGYGNCGSGTSTYNVSLDANVTTAMFGARIVVNGAPATLSAPSEPYNVGVACDPAAEAGWYGALWAPQGSLQAIWSNLSGHASWSAQNASSLPVKLAPGSIFEVLVRPMPSSCSISFYGTNGYSIDGTQDC